MSPQWFEDLLLDLGPTERQPITAAALVCLPPRCPSCGGELTTITSWQPALFIGCDYGAASESTIKRCFSCGWWIATGQVPVNPRVFR
jgi:predicted RNA-binding Zn-ribbon protein involved in translation (DUF1610 family)